MRGVLAIAMRVVLAIATCGVLEIATHEINFMQDYCVIQYHSLGMRTLCRNNFWNNRW